jgi:hypothetical protein
MPNVERGHPGCCPGGLEEVVGTEPSEHSNGASQHQVPPSGIRVVDLDTCAVPAEIDNGGFSAHDFAWFELVVARNYLAQRIKIATVKMEHGLLDAEEMDALILEVAELVADLELWEAYR